MEPGGDSYKKEPGTVLSVVVVLTSLGIMLTGIVVLRFDIHIVLLISFAFVCIVSNFLGYSFDDLVGCMKKPLGQSLPAMIIFIFIGLIIASWICSGTVPVLVVYGIKVISPKAFLPVAFVLCSIVSFAIGTSWGTIGTMGIVMMGISISLGIPVAVTAGAVISGAAFGDKMSPMSDTTNLAPAAAGTTLYEHINAMWHVTGPSWVITLVVFYILGRRYAADSVNLENIELIEATISKHFHVTILVFLPMIVLLVWNILRLPAIPGMALGSAIAVCIAVSVQHMPLAEVISALNYGYQNSTGVDVVDSLIQRGGIQSMMYTFSLSCIAISFGGVLEQVGYLRKVINIFIHKIRRDKFMVPLVIGSTYLGTLSMGEVYLSLVLNGNLYRETFKERGLKLNLLSRLLEEGGTLMQYFIPWSTTGVFVAQTLGVTMGDYARYAVLNYVNPLLSIMLAMFGICVLRENPDVKKKARR